MYVGVVYFAGSLSRWSGKLDEREIIARHESRWRWHTRMMMLRTHANLDPKRCGYALLKNGVCVEQYDPPLTEADMPPMSDDVFEDGTVIDGLTGVIHRRQSHPKRH